MVEFFHIPVLLNECLEGLKIKKDGVYVDATTGSAGHSYHILERLGKKGHLYCFDRDDAAINAAKKRLSMLPNGNYTLIHSNFVNMKEELAWQKINKVDGILFDLGVSSFQLVDSDRGFSYNKDDELDMRMDQNQVLTAKTVVNTYSEDRLAKLIYENSDERYARKIAANIVKQRKIKEISTTFELVDIISASIPGKAKREKGHPAKRTFQAIRIEVNGELAILRDSLEQALAILNKGGRMCVITFHSIEDRIVKQLFKEMTSSAPWHRGMPVTREEDKIEFKLINSKPILPSDAEIESNHRSHSAKLRIIERL